MTNGSWKWAHTFVNRDEIQALAGLKEDINLHVSLETVKRGRLHIQGAFAVAGVSSDVFMDDSVLVDNATGCKAIGEIIICFHKTIPYFSTYQVGSKYFRREKGSTII